MDRITASDSFSAPVQTDPGAHPTSGTTGSLGFRVLERPELGVDHPHTHSAEVKERLELNLYFPLGYRGPP